MSAVVTEIVTETKDAKVGARRDVGPLYQDTRPIGCEFYFAIVAGMALFFGGSMAVTTGFTWLWNGLDPRSQLCECPADYGTFGALPGSRYYDGCIDNSSAWFQTYNAPPANTTFEVEGWFHSTEWSRATLKSLERQVGVDQDEVVEATYKCPVFAPVWLKPVVALDVILLVAGVLGVGWFCATSTIKKNKVYKDRVEVEFWGGERWAVPLYALVEHAAEGSDQKELAPKHAAAEVPPLRKSALMLKSAERLVFGANNLVTSTRVKVAKKKEEGDAAAKKEEGDAAAKGEEGEDTKAEGEAAETEGEATDTKTEPRLFDFRVEPKDVDAFKDALARAQAVAVAKTHYLEGEMPTPAAKGLGSEEENTESYVPGVGFGFVFRALLMLASYFFLIEFGYKGFMYGVKEMTDPGRPKQENEFMREMFDYGYESILTVFLTLVSLGQQFVDAKPTKVVVHGGVLTAFLDRAYTSPTAECMNCLVQSVFKVSAWQSQKTLVLPTAEVLQVRHWADMDCCEKSITIPFDEAGAVYMKAKQWYTIKESFSEEADTIEIARKCAADPDTGASVDVGMFHYLLPSDDISKVLDLLDDKTSEQV